MTLEVDLWAVCTHKCTVCTLNLEDQTMTQPQGFFWVCLLIWSLSSLKMSNLEMEDTLSIRSFLVGLFCLTSIWCLNKCCDIYMVWKWFRSDPPEWKSRFSFVPSRYINCKWKMGWTLTFSIKASFLHLIQSIASQINSYCQSPTAYVVPCKAPGAQR